MKNINENIIYQLIKLDVPTRRGLSDLKRKVAGGFKLPSPSNTDLLQAYRKLTAAKKVKASPWLESLLKKRAVRTLSGVAVVAVLTKPYPCPGQCAYCPSEKNMPKSYLSNEPAVMRAILCKFNPYRQVHARLSTLELNGHPTDKVELILMGGTWSHLPKQYQTWFIKECFRALNSTHLHKFTANAHKSRIKSRANCLNLKDLQKINETAKHRCVGLTLETRPDLITPEEIKRMRELGATRVELGVQAIDDSILQLNKRGHNVETVIRATTLLKDAGFKIMYHMMPNLPGATPSKDLKIFKELFSNPDFCPDMLKIYPCVVTKNSQLYRWWKNGRYKPYTDKQLLELLMGIKEIIPPYVRISRLIRDIPSPSIAAGNKISNLREIIAKEMQKRGLQCQCIRCREIKGDIYNPANVKFVQREYESSGGKEYFLSYEDVKQNKLLAFLRLRIPFKIKDSSATAAATAGQAGQAKLKIKNLMELQDAALIREVHTYGQMVPVKKRGKKVSQHKGFGRRLMKEAEKIVRQSGVKKIAVISGVGVREYYKKLGYVLEGTYMVKYL